MARHWAGAGAGRIESQVHWGWGLPLASKNTGEGNAMELSGSLAPPGELSFLDAFPVNSRFFNG